MKIKKINLVGSFKSQKIFKTYKIVIFAFFIFILAYDLFPINFHNSLLDTLNTIIIVAIMFSLPAVILYKVPQKGWWLLFLFSLAVAGAWIGVPYNFSDIIKPVETFTVTAALVFILIILFLTFYLLFKTVKIISNLPLFPKLLRANPVAFVNFRLIIAVCVFLFNVNQRLANIEERYGGKEKLSCSEAEMQELLNNSVVRIIGSLGEGSGFPLSENEIVTNFHVIDGEPSPKIVFPNGSIETPEEIIGSKLKDIAILKLKRKMTPIAIYKRIVKDQGILTTKTKPSFGEPVYAAGYPLGSSLPGQVSIGKGSYIGERWLATFNMNTLQTDISVEHGMSGGPLVNSCGEVVGVSTAGLSGFSIFIDIKSVEESRHAYTGDEIAKIEIDTSSPIGAVNAFYAYIKAGNLEKAFELISDERKSTISSFEEWTKGYEKTLQVELVKSEVDEEDKNKVNIRLVSMDWINGEPVYKYYQGSWIVGKDLKLDKSDILEISEPDWSWFYE